ncbi:MAG: hypothetical protein M1819_004201 [Sarea resinae]|nr:MAG: hypothetical protein M1819_004201 [Sarea resinae]
MSYGIMGSERGSHMATYQTTQPVRCLYFDGASASLNGDGPMHNQDIFLYGNASRGGNFSWRGPLGFEYDRAQHHCDWVKEKKLGGPGWGVEGIVRMNAGFELIWCNFSSPSLQLVSHLNVTAPLVSKASNIFDREPFLVSSQWQWFSAAAKRYGWTSMGPSGGETRVKVFSGATVNLYSPELKSLETARIQTEQTTMNLTAEGHWRGPGKAADRSLALESLTRRRRLHRMNQISQQDVSSIRGSVQRVLEALNSSTHSATARTTIDIDWTLLIREIVKTYASPLAELVDLLRNSTLGTNNELSPRQTLASIRGRTHLLLLPFFEYPSSDLSNSTYLNQEFTIFSPLGQTTLGRCQKSRTSSRIQKITLLSPEQATLKWAIEGILSGICNAIVEVGLGVEREWLSTYNYRDTDAGDNETQNQRLVIAIKSWLSTLEELSAWLGWAPEWAGCTGGCQAWDICLSLSHHLSGFPPFVMETACHSSSSKHTYSEPRLS